MIKQDSCTEQTGPPNVCHIGIEANIPMNRLSKAFNEQIFAFTLTYYLPVPQTFSEREYDNTNLPSYQNPYAPNSLTSIANNLDADLFSPAKVSAYSSSIPEFVGDSSIISVNTINSNNPSQSAPAPAKMNTDESIKATANDKAASNTDKDSNPTQNPFSSSNNSINQNKPTANLTKSIGTTIHLSIPPSSPSKQAAVKHLTSPAIPLTSDSFEDLALSQENPKTAALIREHRSSSNIAGTSTYTYHGPVGTIDNQTLFQNIISNPHDMYML